MRLKTFIWVYALLEVVMSFNASSNVAHLAHLGGMAGAFIYMRRLRRREQFSLAEWIKAHWDRWRGGGRGGDAAWRSSAPASEEVDRILEKMSRDGYESLTAGERETLEQASRRLRR